MPQFVNLNNQIVNVDHIRLVEVKTQPGNHLLVYVQGHQPITVQGDTAMMLLEALSEMAYQRPSREAAKEAGLKEMPKRNDKAVPALPI